MSYIYTVDDDELIFKEEDTTASTHEVIAKTTESEVKVHSLIKDATVRKKKKTKAPKAPIANKEKKPMPISINLSRIMSEPKKDNVPKTEVNMALRSNLTPIAEEQEIHMMRAFNGIELEDEDETKETSEKKMSLFAAKKAAQQEAKVKKEEDVEDKNFKLETVKSDLKQEDKMLSLEERVTRRLRCAAVLDISDSEDADIPGLEDVHGRKKDESKIWT